MRQLLEIINNANQHLLAARLHSSPVEEHLTIKLQYARLMGKMVDYCKAEFLDAGCLTTAFIRGLHRLLYPEGHTCEAKNAENETVLMYPGKYKLLQQAAINRAGTGSLSVFMSAEETPQAMETIVATLEQQLKSDNNINKKKDGIMVFILEYLQIHPFFDGNGRMACMLADLLLLREGLPLINFSPIYRSNKPAMVAVLAEAKQTRKLEKLYAYIETHNQRI